MWIISCQSTVGQKDVSLFLFYHPFNIGINVVVAGFFRFCFSYFLVDAMFMVLIKYLVLDIITSTKYVLSYA